MRSLPGRRGRRGRPPTNVPAPARSCRNGVAGRRRCASERSTSPASRRAGASPCRPICAPSSRAARKSTGSPARDLTATSRSPSAAPRASRSWSGSTSTSARSAATPLVRQRIQNLPDARILVQAARFAGEMFPRRARTYEGWLQDRERPRILKIIRPPPARRMCGSAALAARNVPRRFTAMTRSHSSALVFSISVQG